MTFPPQETVFDAGRILESITDAFFALDAEGRFTYINRQAEALWGRSRTQMLGRNVWEEFPDAVGGTFDRQFRLASAENRVVAFTEFYPPLDAWLDVCVYPSPNGLSVFFQNVSERRAAEETLRQSEAQARDAQARLDSALLAGGIATWTWDLVQNRVTADAGLARLFSVSAEDAAGGSPEAYLRAVSPDDRPRLTRIAEAASAGRNDFEEECRVALPGGAQRRLILRGKIVRDATGRALSCDGVAIDITDQVERDWRERFLAELAERASRLSDPEEIIADAVRSLGEFLGVSRCIFADIDIEADTCTIHPSEYRADLSVASIAGVVSIASFGAFVVAEYAARRPVAVEDVRLDSVRAPEGSLSAYEAIGIRAHVTVPVVHYDRVVSCMSVHNAAPRQWKLEEVELLRTVVERTWLMVEVARQERALVSEAEATVRVLESISAAFYAVDTEWRFTYINSQAEALWGMSRAQLLGKNVWEEFPEAVGGTFDRQFHRAMAEETAVAFEEFYPPLNVWLEARAFPSPDGLSVFLQNISERKLAEEALRESEERLRLTTEGAGIGIWRLVPATNMLTWTRRCAEIFGLPPDESSEVTGEYAWSLVHPEDLDGMRAAMDRTARENVDFRHEYRVQTPGGETRWVQSIGKPYTDDGGEVVRVEGVLLDITRQREATERLAAAYQKERHVAEALQSALTPPIPERVPGLALAKYYEAALEEAGVGGDFYDIFPIEKGCTALVVGDLSGKGLAAATQVATVRNMLRYAVLRSRTLADAITELNTVLVDQNLLTGFATLFIGLYDSGAGALTYVNCGQEPALVRRKGGEIEPLAPTGAILGSLPDAEYEEATLTLIPGDALAVFTDGLTEVGPSRLEMLGIEGISGLLARPLPAEEMGSAEAVAEHLALSLISGVDAAARDGVMRDDMCLLIAAVE